MMMIIIELSDNEDDVVSFGLAPLIVDKSQNRVIEKYHQGIAILKSLPLVSLNWAMPCKVGHENVFDQDSPKCSESSC